MLDKGSTTKYIPVQQCSFFNYNFHEYIRELPSYKLFPIAYQPRNVQFWSKTFELKYIKEKVFGWFLSCLQKMCGCHVQPQRWQEKAPEATQETDQGDGWGRQSIQTQAKREETWAAKTVGKGPPGHRWNEEIWQKNKSFLVHMRVVTLDSIPIQISGCPAITSLNPYN